MGTPVHGDGSRRVMPDQKRFVMGDGRVPYLYLAVPPDTVGRCVPLAAIDCS